MVSFLILAAVVYFLIVKPYTIAKDKFFPAEEIGVPADVALLEEIRDLLAERRGPVELGVNRGAAAPGA